jgi:ABC-type iron transport system FetAB permease component
MEELVMSTDNQVAESTLQRHGWVLLFALEIVLAPWFLVVLVFIETPEGFEADTGVAWAEFSAAYPTVATGYQLAQRAFLVGYISLTLLALLITCFAFRKGHRWSWFAMWLFPAALAAMVVLMALHDAPELAGIYGVIAGLAAIGLLLPIRKFFPGSG